MAMAICALIKLMTIDSLSYTKENWFYDHFFSMEVIREAPLVSQNYYITYSAHDGNKPETNIIFFMGTVDQLKLESYLIAKGFIPENIDANTIRWRSLSYSEYDVYLSVYPDKKEIIMAAVALD
ncbi:hypothetical protein PEC302107_01400 [Pectobacterium araliae]|nr:hypothetical protein PEC302107_01400 [Pectobacterium carotovorum subsp. carotovorum]